MTLPETTTWETNPPPAGDDDFFDQASSSIQRLHGAVEDDNDDNNDYAGNENDNQTNRNNTINEGNDETNPTISGQPASSSRSASTTNEIIYSIESYGAIVTPVSITMILSALAVVYINTDETIKAGETAYASTYQVIDVTESNTTGQNVGASLLNTLVIVIVICVMTFIIVILYKYHCMKLFYGYMIIVTTTILGYFTSNMFLVAINIYGWRVDKFSFALVMYNYAIVGTIAIFYQRGIPKWVTQGYLITSSVCLAWQLSYFSSWMAWTLLVMLALYDLFAVLSPCGPLKALANLISRPGAPALPGLLYEASLPQGIQKPKKDPNRKEQTEEDNQNEQQQLLKAERDTNEERRTNASQRQHKIENGQEEKVPEIDDVGQRSHHYDYDSATEPSTRSQFSISDRGIPIDNRGSASTTTVTTVSSDIATEHRRSSRTLGRQRLQDTEPNSAIPDGIDTSNTGQVPLALAKMYKIDILDPKGVLRQRRFAKTWQQYYTAQEIREKTNWTSKQLRTEVIGIFPPRGGIIQKAKEQKYDAGIAYVVYNRLGEEIRKFVVTPEGKIMQVMRRENGGNHDNNNNKDDNSIKLGIGDFVFYSVLVSKAAQYSFTTFATCFLVVLSGLAATLVILALKGKALPALPISIFLGVLCFLGTKELIQPWVQDLLRLNLYV